MTAFKSKNVGLREQKCRRINFAQGKFVLEGLMIKLGQATCIILLVGIKNCPLQFIDIDN